MAGFIPAGATGLTSTTPRLSVFDQYSLAKRIELESEDFDKFNVASGGTILAQSRPTTGDFPQIAEWKHGPAAGRMRNIDRTQTIAAQKLSQNVLYDVNVAYAYGPVEITRATLEWARSNEAEAGNVYSANLAEYSSKKKLELSFGIISAILSLNNSTTLNLMGTKKDGTEAARLDYKQLKKAAFLLGAEHASIGAWLMHTDVFEQYTDANLDGYERLFVGSLLAGTSIYREPILGKPIIITDSEALKFQPVIESEIQNGANGAGLQGYLTFGLLPGALTCFDGGSQFTNFQVNNGGEHIAGTRQTEWTGGFTAKGSSYLTAKGRTPLEHTLTALSPAGFGPVSIVNPSNTSQRKNAAAGDVAWARVSGFTAGSLEWRKQGLGVAITSLL